MEIERRLEKHKAKQLSRELTDARLKALLNCNYTHEEIARVTGLSLSTIRARIAKLGAE